MTAPSKHARAARLAGSALGVLVGLGATTPYFVRHAREKAVLHQLGLEARAAEVRHVTAGDFNRDGRQPDYRVDFADGSVEYFLHRGYAAYPARPDPLPRHAPQVYLAGSEEFVPARQIYER